MIKYLQTGCETSFVFFKKRVYTSFLCPLFPVLIKYVLIKKNHY